MNKKIGMIAALAVFGFGMLNANEIIKIEKSGDLSKSSKVSRQGNLLIVKGSADLFSAKTIKLDPNKKYRLTGDFRLQSGSPVQVFLGYVAQDSNGKTIFPLYVNPVSGSTTEIAATVRRGSKVITVKDASAWNKKFSACYIAFNVKDDFSDFKSVYHADTNAIYQQSFLYSFDRDPHKRPAVVELGKDEYLVFRTRTKVNEKGRLIFANYGVLYGPWAFVGPGGMKISFLAFNPTPNDTNLEPKR